MLSKLLRDKIGDYSRLQKKRFAMLAKYERFIKGRHFNLEGAFKHQSEVNLDWPDYDHHSRLVAVFFHYLRFKFGVTVDKVSCLEYYSIPIQSTKSTSFMFKEKIPKRNHLAIKIELNKFFHYPNKRLFIKIEGNLVRLKTN